MNWWVSLGTQCPGVLLVAVAVSQTPPRIDSDVTIFSPAGGVSHDGAREQQRDRGADSLVRHLRARLPEDARASDRVVLAGDAHL